MTQSVEDGSTVKIFYESRLAKVWLDDNKLKEIDKYYDELAIQGVSDDIIDPGDLAWKTSLRAFQRTRSRH